MKHTILLILALLISLNLVLACVDINTASLSELDEIIWIGPATAQKIVDARPFESVDDLIKVSGIGEIKLQDIKDQGLACVDLDEENELELEDEEEEEEEKNPEETIQEETQERQKVEVIKLNPKDINSDKNTSKIIKSNYALYGLGIFAIFMMLLLLFRKKDKNEFE